MTHRSSAFYIAVLVCTWLTPAVDLKDSRVRVPWTDFKQILDRLAAIDSTRAPDTTPAPRDYLIGSIALSGLVNDDKSVPLTAEYGISVFPSANLKQSGWIRVPIGRSEAENGKAVVTSVSMEGRSVPIDNSDGSCNLLFSRPGFMAVTVAYACPLTLEEGTKKLSLDLPNAAAGYLDLKALNKRYDFSVNGIKRQSTIEAGSTRIQCAFAPGGALSLALSPQADNQGMEAKGVQMSPKIFAVTGLLVTIKENQVRYRFKVDYQIWHKKLSLFSLAIPDTLQVEQVEGPGIQDWNVEGPSGSRRLTVHTNFTPEKEYSMTVDFSQKLETASGTVRVPEIIVREANRESGCFAVQAAKTIEVFCGDSASGVTPAENGELPSWLQQAPDVLLKYKYSRHPCRMVLDMKRHSDMPVLVAIADEARFQVQYTRDGYALAKFKYMVRNNHKQYLQVTMKPGWKLWSALIDGYAVMPAGGKDPTVLLVPLKKSAISREGSGFVVELVYWNEAKKMRFFGGLSFAMPVIDINCQQITGEVWAPEKFSYSSFKGSLKKVPSTESRYLNATSYAFNERRSGRAPLQQSMVQNVMAQTQRPAKKAFALPVEIDIPTEGTQVHFTKNLTVAGEDAAFSFRFFREIRLIERTGFIVAWFMALLIGILLVIAVTRARGVKKRLLGLVGALAGFLFVLIINEATGLNAPGLTPLFILGMVISLFAVCARLPKKLSPGAGALLLAGSFLSLWTPVQAQTAEKGDLGDASIVIPWSDFKPIVERLKSPLVNDSADIVPPIDYAIANARFEGEKLSAIECAFAAEMTVTVLNTKSWVEIPLGEGCALYPGITLNGRQTPIGKNENGQALLLLKGAGTYKLAYRFAAPIEERDGKAATSFPLPKQAAASMTLYLREGGYAVTANERRLATRPAPGRGVAYYGGIGGADRVTLAWEREVSKQAGNASLLIGQANTFYSIGMGTVQMRSQITLSILHQTIRQFTLALPVTTEVIDCSGPAVAAWESGDSAGMRYIKIFLNYNVENSTAFTLTAEQPYGDLVKIIALPCLVLCNTTRQEGFIGVGVISNVEISQEEQSSNVIRKDKRELPAWFESQGDALYSYQYLSGNYAVSFALTPHQNESALSALITDQNINSVMREDGKTITEIRMTVKNRGEQFLHLQWRKNWQLWSLFCNEEAARPAFDSLSGELLIPLAKSAESTAETKITLVYLRLSTPYGTIGRQVMEYPRAAMPAQKTHCSLYIPQGISPFNFGGNLRHDDKGENRYFSLFRPLDWLMLGVKPANVSTDFYQKIPEERAALLNNEGTEAKSVVLRKRGAKGEDLILAGTTGLANGRGGPQARVGQQGMLERQEAPAQEAQVFGNGGFAGEIDEALGRQMLLPSASTESGLLSIPVTITYEGVPRSFKTLLLKTGEPPHLSFFYRKVPANTPWFVSLCLFLCMAAAGGFLARGFWTGWSKKLVLYGIALPFIIGFLLSRIVDAPLSLNPLWVIPLLFYAWKAIVGIKYWLGARRKQACETETALKEARQVRSPDNNDTREPTNG